MYRCVQVTIYLQIYAYFIFNFTACISYPVCSMCKGLYNQLHLFFLYYVYVTKYWLFDSFQIKKTKCSHGTFLSHLDIIIVTVDCQFTATSVSLLRHVCPLRVAGAKGSD